MKTLLAATALLLAGCGEPDVTVATLPKSAEAAAAARDLLAWTLPKGWRQEAGEGMRYATLVAGPVGRGYEVAITRMEGDAGGDLANVNRWRGQLWLAPLDAKALERSITRLHAQAGEVLYVDLRGKDVGGKATRLLAAGVKVGDASWFFKMSGPKGELDPYAPQFKQLLKSLRRRS